MIRYYLQLWAPLDVRKFDGYWCVVIKGTHHNILHYDSGIFVTFKTEESAREALAHVREMRYKIRFKQVLKVG